MKFLVIDNKLKCSIPIVIKLHECMKLRIKFVSSALNVEGTKGVGPFMKHGKRLSNCIHLIHMLGSV